MPILTRCGQCQQQLGVPDGALGKKIRCQACGHVFVAEAPRVEPEPPPPTVEPIEVAEAPVVVKAAEVTAAPAATAIQDEVKSVPRAPSKKKSSPPPMKTGKAPPRADSKPSPRKQSGANKLLVVGLAGFVVLSVLCLGGGASAWLFFRNAAPPHPDDAVAKQDEKKGAKGPDAIEEDPVEGPKIIPVEIKAPKLEQDKVVRDLPGNIDQIALGGGGRYILLNMPQLRKIAMFDASEAKVVHYFAVSGDNVKFAASVDKLVMVFPGTKIIQRWSLVSKEREVTSNLAGPENIRTVLMGCASNGPLVLAGGDRFGGGGVAFLDLKTLKPLDIQGGGNAGGRGLGDHQARVSADGSVFGAWGTGSPTGLQTYVLQGKQLKSHYEHTTVGHIAPGPDGKIVYTGSGMYTNEVRPLGTNTNRNGNGKFTIPAVHGNYYLTINRDRFDFDNRKPATITVHIAGEERPLITLANIDMAETGDRFAQDAVGLDQRYILIPDAKMLVVVPQTNNKIIIHRFDVEEAMDKAGIDFLYVTSRPPLSAGRGKTFNYQIAVKSKKGGVKYKLEAGPDGMKVASDGKVTWPVPKDLPDGEQNVIVTVSDKTGQEIFHTFKVAVGQQQAGKGDPFQGKRDPFEDKFFEDKRPFVEDIRPFEEKKNDPPVLVKTDLPPQPARLPIAPPKLDADKVTRSLPDTISDVAIGGGGRFLICQLPKTRQLAIFDANEGKVVKFLPLAGDNARIAAGMTKLIVAFPDTKIMQRWDLTTFQRELSTTLPLNDRLSGIGMGYGSDGPLLVQTGRGAGSGEQLFFDIKTMKRMDITRNAIGHCHIGENAKVRGSFDGRVLGVQGEMENGHTLTIENGGKFTARGAEHAWTPSADGNIVMGNGVNTREGQNKARINMMHCVPALQGQFYLGIPSGNFHPGIPGDKEKFPSATLYISGDTRPLITLPDVEKNVRDHFGGFRDPLRIDQRYHFIPDAQILVTIPSTCDKLIVQKLDLDAALDKAGIDYLFVNSMPFPYAVKGEEFKYTVQAKSKKGVKKYNVDAGPEGMKASPAGVVTWKVPKDFAESSVDVIMSIADKADQEVFHTFKLVVVSELPAGVKRDAGPGVLPKEEKKPPVKEEPEPVIKLPPVKASDLAIKAPTLDADKVTRELPDTIGDVAVGGGGRFLLLSIPKVRKIAMFDVNEAKIVHYFAVSGDNVKFAAGMDKLVMVFPDTKIIQRWNLATKEREVTGTLPDVANIGAVVMGSASQGPVLIAGGNLKFGGGGGGTFIDLKTLKAITFTMQGQGGLPTGPNTRAAADGSVFACGDTDLQSAVISGKTLKSYRDFARGALVIPAPDGKVLYTSNGHYTPELKPIGNTDRGRIGIPAVHGNYYFTVNYGGGLLPGPKKKGPKASADFSVDVHFAGDERTLVTLNDLDMGTIDRFGGIQGFPIDRRIHFIPQAKVIVTIPTTNNKLVIHRFDVDEAMDKAGIDYLYVTSRAPAEVRSKAELIYPIAVKSKKGGVQFKLDAGPDGMKLTKAGVIVWKVPADQPPGEVNVIVTVSDSSGQEIFHTFRVTVVEDAAEDRK